MRDATPIRILIADDHVLVRRSLRMLLNLQPGLQVVGDAGSGQHALELALQLRPDVVLADLSMPPPDGISLARELGAVLPQTRTIIVSMNEDADALRAALAAGAAGYVIKRGVETQLVEAIRAAARGERYVDPLLD